MPSLAEWLQAPPIRRRASNDRCSCSDRQQWARIRRQDCGQSVLTQVEAAAKNEVQLSEYCRQRGLYPEQLRARRQLP